MNKNILVAIITLLLIFWACSPRKETKGILSVSINPQKYFLERIVKGKYTINTVIPNGSSPESFDPSPSQMIALGQSLIYFKVGLFGFEKARINDILGDKPNFDVVDCSLNIPLDTSNCEDHGHAMDPHIWSSPKTARIMAENMYNAVIARDPVNKLFYSNNLTDLLHEFDRTDSIIKSYLAKAPSRSFVIFHPALSYFSHEYGLHQLSIESEGKSPTPARLKSLIDQARADNVKVVFMQEEFDKKNAETIAHEIGARVVSINLLSTNWSDEMIKVAKALSLGNE